jgi:hypothetical protein
MVWTNIGETVDIVSAGWELTISVFPTGKVLREYCQAEAMSFVTGVIRCTADDNKQHNLLCWLSSGTDRSSLFDLQFKSALSVLGNKYLHWTLPLFNKTQPLALQKFHLKIMFQLKIMFLGKRDLESFQCKGMVLGNRYIIPPIRIKGLAYRSGSEFSCHKNKVDKGVSPHCQT